MRRRLQISAEAVLLTLILLILSELSLSQSVFAQSPWQATYWNNATLSGTPVLTRQELTIDYEWEAGSPDPDVESDSFSARWVRTERLEEGTYRFTATVDDGIRVWVNGIRIIDSWEIASIRTLTTDVYLTAGLYETRVEYFEATGVAAVTLDRTLLGGATPDNNRPIDDISGEAPELNTANWRGEYYNNASLSGTPDLIRGENNIDFDWGSGSPAPDIITPETFSARWMRTLNLDGGRYRFAVTADDGVRLYVNDRLLINEWHDQAATTYTAESELSGGPTTIRIEYYENRDQATARFSYAELLSPPTPPPAVPESEGTWRGEYFDNVNLSGPPLFVRTDPAIDFDWGVGSPAPDRLGVDRFSVRWTDSLNLTPGRYRFFVTADDGVRLHVNGETVIDEFTVQSAQEYVVERNIPSGRADIEMEYFENTGQAVARLSWSQVDSVLAPSDPTGQTTATVVGAANLNVRGGPGVAFRPIAVLARGQIVEMIGRNRATSWVQIILFDGRTGWVHARYLSSNTAYGSLPVTG